jgi:glycosyltransferase involved in cell wall biosynthesis
MSDGEYLVEIPMCTYNQGNFIAQAIEGILKQKTTFKYRVIIGEDSSIDNTKEIVQGYIDKYPEKVKGIFHERNLGVYENSKILFSVCKAKYIALCDGDDYWIDPNKLQSQVEFLESNPAYSFCFHRVYDLSGDGELVLSPVVVNSEPKSFSINDLAKGNFIHTLSVVYRNNFKNGLPDWFHKAPIGDYVLHMLNASFGDFYYMPRPMGVYRKFIGMYGAQGSIRRNIDNYETLQLLFQHFDDDAIRVELIKQQALSLVYLYKHEGFESLKKREPIVKAVLDIVMIKSANDLIEFKSKMLILAILKKIFMFFKQGMSSKVALIKKKIS